MRLARFHLGTAVRAGYTCSVLVQMKHEMQNVEALFPAPRFLMCRMDRWIIVCILLRTAFTQRCSCGGRVSGREASEQA